MLVRVFVCVLACSFDCCLVAGLFVYLFVCLFVLLFGACLLIGLFVCSFVACVFVCVCCGGGGVLVCV